MVSLAIETGMRRGEIVKLNWQNVDMVNRTALLRETKMGKTGPSHYHQRQSLPFNYMQARREQRAKCSLRQGLVFSNPGSGF